MAEFFGVAPEVLWTLFGVLGVLVFSSVAVRVLERRNPDGDYVELRQRVRTWWVMIGVFTTALLLNRGVSLAFFAFVSFMAMKEYFSLIPTRRADRRVLFWAYAAIPVQYGLIAAEWFEVFVIFVPVYCFLWVPLRLVLTGETDGFLRSAGTIHWGMMLTLFCVSHAAYLLVLRLPEGHAEAGKLVGPGLLLFLVGLTQGNDVMQYVWGKTLGRRKIVPKVSPGKTWGGFLGGVLTTAALATLLGPFLTPLNWWESLAAGAVIAVAGFVGDVTVSALKRDLNIKDSGSILPGHGGLLDRIDSLTYTAPLFFHLTYWWIW